MAEPSYLLQEDADRIVLEEGDGDLLLEDGVLPVKAASSAGGLHLDIGTARLPEDAPHLLTAIAVLTRRRRGYRVTTT